MRRILVVAVLVLLSACNDGSRFTQEGWWQTDVLDRHVFVADLISRRLLIGKPRGEVERMLGRGYRQAESTSWNIGVERESGRAQVLQVDFSNGVAVRAAVHGTDE